MTMHLGDVPAGITLYILFATYGKTNGESITLSGLLASDIEIYKNGSVTQRASDAGYTLLDTDGIDFDGITGIHGFSIDLADNTDAGFYAVGSQYWVVVSAVTIDAQTVNFIAATFRVVAAENTSGTPVADAVRISGDAVAADNAESFFDGTGYAGTGNVIPTVTTTTNLTNERGKYAEGAVWIGPTANTNTVSYTDGIITNPVSTISAAKTIADALNLRRFVTIRTGATQIGAAMVGYDFDGEGWSLTTTGGSRDVGTSTFERAELAGGTFAATSGAIHWFHCEFPVAVSVGVSNFNNCTFGNTLTLSEAGSYDFIDCSSIVAGSAAPVFAIPAGTVNVAFSRWSGSLRITGITSGTTISIDVVSGASVTLEGANGDVQVHGMVGAITDSRTGSPTLTQNATLNRTVLATPTNITAGTITTATNVTTVNGLAANVITAASIAADAITDAKVASDVTIASVTGSVGSIATGGIAAAAFAAGAITAAAIATDAIDADALAADAVADIQAGLSTLTAAGVRTAVGLATANLDTQLAALAGYIDTEVTTILAAVDTEVAAIKAKTDNLPASPAAVGSAMILSATGLDLVLPAQPAGPPTWGTSSIVQWVAWAGAFDRNKKTQTATTATLRNFADTANLATATVSDDATTFTISAWS